MLERGVVEPGALDRSRVDPAMSRASQVGSLGVDSVECGHTLIVAERPCVGIILYVIPYGIDY